LCFCWDSDNDDEEDDDGCQSNRLLNENAATTNEDMTLMENVVMKAKQRADLSRRLCLIRFDYDDDGIRMLLLDLELKFDEGRGGMTGEASSCRGGIININLNDVKREGQRNVVSVNNNKPCRNRFYNNVQTSYGWEDIRNGSPHCHHHRHQG